MDWRDLDGQITELAELIQERKSILSFSGSFVSTPTEIVGFQRNDWRPVWAKCKEIQAAFNAKIRFPVREQQDDAWLRFNNLRNEASRLANDERQKFSNMSQHYRSVILDEIKYARYSPVTDVLFFFDPTTVNDMKQKGQMLKRAGALLSENKERMSKEHKDECFGQIQEARETHQLFWEQRKAAVDQRHREWKARHRAHIAKAEGNIEKNEGRLAKQQEALSRVEAQIDDLTEKVYSARSDEWRDRFSGWLEAAQEKKRSIEDGIEQTNRWLEQDRERLEQMMRKLD